MQLYQTEHKQAPWNIVTFVCVCVYQFIIHCIGDVQNATSTFICVHKRLHF